MIFVAKKSATVNNLKYVDKEQPITYNLISHCGWRSLLLHDYMCSIQERVVHVPINRISGILILVAGFVSWVRTSEDLSSKTQC